ncbi:Protein trapped in endoderm-1 [Amphibalanus amphitrite]|uniref:Protein trapped in endoderm-1 n=1 Tax=Amphibalanus amphitrite TaxID=1232801 RepID=A0A6A4VPW2_AMPAM|nr:Protein trapped in endoderm-1 [Amphibalanus amphitrite]
MEANSTAAAGDLPGGGGDLSHTEPGPDPAQVHYPRAATVTAAVCCVIFIVVGVIGNLLTLIVLRQSLRMYCALSLSGNLLTLIVLRQSLRMPGRLSTAATLFLLSLCVSDLLFCAINLPLTASRSARSRSGHVRSYRGHVASCCYMLDNAVERIPR